MTEEISRRRFLSLSTGGVFALALSPLFLSNSPAHAALPPEENEDADLLSDSGSWFTSSNPLPNGRTWNASTVQDTIDIDSIPLSDAMKVIAAGKLASKLLSVVPQLKAYAAATDLATDIIALAVSKGYGNSKKMSTRTKVYYPNGGRRVSANGVSPVRYVEKHVTHYYAKENQKGSINKTTIRYKIIEVG